MKESIGVVDKQLVGVKRYNNKKRKVWDRRLFVISILILPILSFLIFYVVVNFEAFFYSFMRTKEGVGVFDPTFTNYRITFESFFMNGGTGLISNGALAKSLLNVLLFNVVGICFGLPISVLFGYFLYKKIKGYKFFRFIIYLPSILSSAALMVLYKQVIGRGGVLDTWFNTFQQYGNHQPWNVNGVAIYYLLFYCFIFGFGTNMIVINGAMNAINKETIEASQLDGCNWFQELIHIIFPSIWPTISTILIMCAAGFLGASGPLLAFVGLSNGNISGTYTLSYYLYVLVYSSTNPAGEGKDLLYLASAIGVCMTLVSFPLALIVKRVCYGKEK